MKNLRPYKIYNSIAGRIFYYTDKKGKLVGSYMSGIAAREGLKNCIEEDNEKEKEIKKEKLLPHRP